MPEVSVLMPVRNVEATVGLAVASTLRAMPRDAELVIWDDASTDSTRRVLAEIDDRRLRVIGEGERIGPGAALRALADATDSRFVARMDGDDVCLPGRFRRQLAILRRGGVDFLFSSTVSFRSEPLRLRPTLPARITAEAVPLHLLVTNLLCHPSMTATRDSLDRAGGYRSTPAEDYDLWLRAASRGARMMRGAVPVVAYRHHSGQVSSAAGFTRAAFLDPALQANYRALLLSELGLESPHALASPETVSWRSTVLRPALVERAQGLDRMQRRLVERTLRLIPEM